MSIHELQLNGHVFHLLPERALFWPSKRTLIISDLHLGKSGHFRKHGIAAPQQINEKNLSRLDQLVKKIIPRRVLILGDLFHSSVNREWFRLEEWLANYPDTEFHLVTGNHDILHSSFYQATGLNTHSILSESGFRFMHDYKGKDERNDDFILSGHIHPGIQLKGTARQSISLPCFYWKKNHLILPAFGEFTGLFSLNIIDAIQVFAVADGMVLPIKKSNY